MCTLLSDALGYQGNYLKPAENEIAAFGVCPLHYQQLLVDLLHRRDPRMLAGVISR